MTLKEKAIKSVGWQLLNIIVQALGNLVYIFVLSRILTPSVFGEFAIAGVILALILTFTEFGFGAALIQLKTINQYHISAAFLTSFLIGIVFSALLITLAAFISSYFNYSIQPSVIKLLSLILIIAPIGVISKSLLIRKLDYESLFKANTISYIIGNIIVTIWLALNGYGIFAIIIGHICTQLILTILQLYYNPISISFKRGTRELKEILKFGFGLTSVRFLNQLSNEVDKLVLAKFIPSTSLGMYERSQKIQVLPLTFISGALDGIVFSLLSKFQENLKKVSRYFFSFLNLISFLTIYLSITIFFLSEEIIAILLGPQWKDAVLVLKIISGLIFFQTFSRFADSLVRSLNEFKKSFIIKVVFTVTIIVLTYMGYKNYGLQGALFGILLSNIMHSFLMVLLANNITKTPFRNFISQFIPVLVFGSILILKNYALFSIFDFDLLGNLFIVLFTDFLLLILLMAYPIIIGKGNLTFLLELFDFPKFQTFVAKHDLLASFQLRALKYTK